MYIFIFLLFSKTILKIVLWNFYKLHFALDRWQILHVAACNVILTSLSEFDKPITYRRDWSETKIKNDSSSRDISGHYQAAISLEFREKFFPRKKRTNEGRNVSLECFHAPWRRGLLRESNSAIVICRVQLIAISRLIGRARAFQ